MDGTDHALALEVATFEEKRAELLAEYAGKFALVKGTSIIGVYVAEMDAVAQGYARSGRTPFLVRRIAAMDDLIQIPALTLELRQL